MAGIACTNTASRLATRQLTNLYDEALEPTELKATQAALLAQMRHWMFERRHQMNTFAPGSQGQVTKPSTFISSRMRRAASPPRPII